MHQTYVSTFLAIICRALRSFVFSSFFSRTMYIHTMTFHLPTHPPTHSHSTTTTTTLLLRAPLPHLSPLPVPRALLSSSSPLHPSPHLLLSLLSILSRPHPTQPSLHHTTHHLLLPLHRNQQLKKLSAQWKWQLAKCTEINFRGPQVYQRISAAFGCGVRSTPEMNQRLRCVWIRSRSSAGSGFKPRFLATLGAAEPQSAFVRLRS